jgi:transcription initiation factor TFIID TATA-box-binding protein
MPGGLKFRIVNVVSTADLGQEVDLSKLNKHGWGLYDLDIYPGGYIKDGWIQGKVTVFHSGKLISVGASNALASVGNLDHAKKLLVSVGLVENVILSPKIRNIVVSGDLGHKMDLEKIAKTAPNVMYEPEQFGGIIVKRKGSSVSILIFANGKVIIAGAKNEFDVRESAKLIEEMDGH